MDSSPGDLKTFTGLDLGGMGGVSCAKDDIPLNISEVKIRSNILYIRVLFLYVNISWNRLKGYPVKPGFLKFSSILLYRK